MIPSLHPDPVGFQPKHRTSYSLHLHKVMFCHIVNFTGEEMKYRDIVPSACPGEYMWVFKMEKKR